MLRHAEALQLPGTHEAAGAPGAPRHGAMTASAMSSQLARTAALGEQGHASVAPAHSIDSAPQPFLSQSGSSPCLCAPAGDTLHTAAQPFSTPQRTAACIAAAPPLSKCPGPGGHAAPCSNDFMPLENDSPNPQPSGTIRGPSERACVDAPSLSAQPARRQRINYSTATAPSPWRAPGDHLLCHRAPPERYDPVLDAARAVLDRLMVAGGSPLRSVASGGVLWAADATQPQSRAAALPERAADALRPPAIYLLQAVRARQRRASAAPSAPEHRTPYSPGCAVVARAPAGSRHAAASSVVVQGGAPMPDSVRSMVDSRKSPPPPPPQHEAPRQDSEADVIVRVHSQALPEKPHEVARTADPDDPHSPPLLLAGAAASQLGAPCDPHGNGDRALIVMPDVRKQRGVQAATPCTPLVCSGSDTQQSDESSRYQLPQLTPTVTPELAPPTQHHPMPFSGSLPPLSPESTPRASFTAHASPSERGVRDNQTPLLDALHIALHLAMHLAKPSQAQGSPCLDSGGLSPMSPGFAVSPCAEPGQRSTPDAFPLGLQPLPALLPGAAGDSARGVSQAPQPPPKPASPVATSAPPLSTVFDTSATFATGDSALDWHWRTDVCASLPPSSACVKAPLRDCGGTLPPLLHDPCSAPARHARASLAREDQRLLVSAGDAGAAPMQPGGACVPTSPFSIDLSAPAPRAETRRALGPADGPAVPCVKHDARKRPRRSSGGAKGSSTPAERTAPPSRSSHGAARPTKRGRKASRKGRGQAADINSDWSGTEDCDNRAELDVAPQQSHKRPRRHAAAKHSRCAAREAADTAGAPAAPASTVSQACRHAASAVTGEESGLGVAQSAPFDAAIYEPGVQGHQAFDAGVASSVLLDEAAADAAWAAGLRISGVAALAVARSASIVQPARPHALSTCSTEYALEH